MTIKIDLEKAYDRVDRFYSCLSLSSRLCRMLFFCLNLDLHQTRVLALFLSFYALHGMAWSFDSFSYFGGKVEPNTYGSPISHLFFTDDLVIFSKADLVHCRIIKDILDRFCGFCGHLINVRNILDRFCGHLINARKTNIFFSKGVDISLTDMISSIFGFQKVHDLGIYLGVPLFHQRLTNSTMNFVVEKVWGSYIVGTPKKSPLLVVFI